MRHLKTALRNKSETSGARQGMTVLPNTESRPSQAIKIKTLAEIMKLILLIYFLTSPSTSMAEWVKYSTRTNGDVFFFDDARVQKNGNSISVWNRVQYKSSLMGASSHQSFLRIDCSEYSETTLQSTFYSDKNWNIPAMATNTREKPKQTINANSSTERLANILCKE